MIRSLRALSAALLLFGGCVADPSGGAEDLGRLATTGKADGTVVREVPFTVEPGMADEPGAVSFSFATEGALSFAVLQDEGRSRERLQLSVEGPEGTERSRRGRAPYIDLAEPADEAAMELSVLNWGKVPAYGIVRISFRDPQSSGRVDVSFNQPDCGGCSNPAGDLRKDLVSTLGKAKETIDLALFGLDDPAIIEALCGAVDRGVKVRAVTDDKSADEDNSRGYHSSFFDKTSGLVGCGVEVEPVLSSSLMHHKFIIVDRDSKNAVLATGSANLTTAGLEANHNHFVFLKEAPRLVEAYSKEFEQLFSHCRKDRQDDRSCSECTPSCVENRSEEGPFGIAGGQIQVFFSPSDDALRVLRGLSASMASNKPDPDCDEKDATCVCRTSGNGYVCDYCALDGDGFGIIGRAKERVLFSVYSATDACFALGVRRAHERGVDVLSVWDLVLANIESSRDDYLCAADVPTYVSAWGGGSPLVRNHNKLVVADDAVFDGSMNLSESGADENNENTLLIQSESIANLFADYIESEVELLESLGVKAQKAKDCLCNDLVDNDKDGRFDGDDPNCDGAGTGG
ncbi:MAG: hypothetical protein KC416_09230 [Myxococcales bacterium]|nr:hypothetical protein [Myxococcales bacterium]